MPAMPQDPEALPLRRGYAFLEKRGLTDEAQAIRTSRDSYLSYTSTLKRGRMVVLLREKGLIDDFTREEWKNGATENGRKLAERYANIYQQFLAGVGGDVQPEEEEDAGEIQFAFEAHLRDSLAGNLHIIEKGLSLWPVGPDQRAVEYRIDGSGRRVDILARDTAGLPVVIELKVSKGHEQAIGQALYYRGRIKELLKAASARIVIVAREISPELRTAAKDIDSISLFEYRLSMVLTVVQ